MIHFTLSLSSHGRSNSSSQALNSLSNRIQEIQKAQQKTLQDRRQHENELARNLQQVQNANNGGGGGGKNANKNQSGSNSKGGDSEMSNLVDDGMDWQGENPNANAGGSGKGFGGGVGNGKKK